MGHFAAALRRDEGGDDILLRQLDGAVGGRQMRSRILAGELLAEKSINETRKFWRSEAHACAIMEEILIRHRLLLSRGYSRARQFQ